MTNTQNVQPTMEPIKFEVHHIIDSQILETIIAQKIRQLQLISEWITAHPDEDMTQYIIHRDKLQNALDIMFYEWEE